MRPPPIAPFLLLILSQVACVSGEAGPPVVGAPMTASQLATLAPAADDPEIASPQQGSLMTNTFTVISVGALALIGAILLVRACLACFDFTLERREVEQGEAAADCERV